MRNPFTRPGFLTALSTVSATAAAAFVLLAVAEGDTGGGLVLLMAGTGAFVCLVLAGLSVAAIGEARRMAAERDAAELAATNDRDNNISR